MVCGENELEKDAMLFGKLYYLLSLYYFQIQAS